MKLSQAYRGIHLNPSADSDLFTNHPPRLTRSSHSNYTMAAASSMAFREQLISAASPVPRYRRSTLTKAPRKRTFIANMLKYSASDMPTSGSASAGAWAFLMWLTVGLYLALRLPCPCQQPYSTLGRSR